MKVKKNADVDGRQIPACAGMTQCAKKKGKRRGHYVLIEIELLLLAAPFSSTYF